MVINPIVGVYIPIIRIPIKGGMTIPNIATFDHGTHVLNMFGFENPTVFFNAGRGSHLKIHEKILSGQIITTFPAE